MFDRPVATLLYFKFNALEDKSTERKYNAATLLYRNNQMFTQYTKCNINTFRHNANTAGKHLLP